MSVGFDSGAQGCAVATRGGGGGCIPSLSAGVNTREGALEVCANMLIHAQLVSVLTLHICNISPPHLDPMNKARL